MVDVTVGAVETIVVDFVVVVCSVSVNFFVLTSVKVKDEVTDSLTVLVVNDVCVNVVGTLVVCVVD